MNDHLFSYEYEEPLGEMVTQYEGCKLKQPIDSFKEGESIPYIYVDFLSGNMEFLEADGETIAVFNIRTEVHDRVYD